MKAPRLKEYMSHYHMPTRHDVAIRWDHMIHDERFWPIMLALLLILAFVAIAIWAGMTAESEVEVVPTYPFLP